MNEITQGVIEELDGRISWCAYETDTYARVGVIGEGICVLPLQERDYPLSRTEVTSLNHNDSDESLDVGSDIEHRPGEVAVWFDVDITE